MLQKSAASCASTSFCDNIVAIAYISVVFGGCGDYIIPLLEVLCYCYVQLCAVIALKAEMYITFLTESRLGSFSQLLSVKRRCNIDDKNLGEGILQERGQCPC